MEFKIGKVYSYNNGLGKIITSNDEYIFNSNDIEYEDVKKGDIVKFRPEVINDVNRAFFISKADNKEYNDEENTLKKEKKND